MSLRTMFDSDRAPDADLSIDIDLGREQFRATVRRTALDLRRSPAMAEAGPTRTGETDRADAKIVATPHAFIELVYSGRPTAEHVAAGTVTVDGDTAAVERFVACFSLPNPATLPPQESS
ncbi:alkyl sulfatase C-terminal domain-containing protein [Saccharomonospora sp. CUA-673]|uniref:alkyl sulfatase C-terminal domain-containing protein n=1 Tax=Saccharomonospora sp. CUA-673 TaxID=1904969 RepID=UPI002101AE99|nr:alkyl sulfatase C-terminal domain-containing protein [Saccharomonospora sp. CUA-673]